MVTDRRSRLPPYVSYRTFLTFLEDLQQGIPSRIDRSYWEDKFSGSTGTQLVAALRFLGLIDTNGIPNNQLKELVVSKGPQKAETLKKISSESFTFLSGSTFDPQQATYAQLEEVFNSIYQVDGDVARKCIKFFIGLTTDAGIPLSSYITKKRKKIHTGILTKKVSRKTGILVEQSSKIPKNAEAASQYNSWNELLLAKFPTFDPGWPNDIQLKWFEAFDQLLKRG